MKNMNIRYITAPLIILLIMVASSCLDDDRSVDFANVGSVIEMLDAQAGRSEALNTADADNDGQLDDIIVPVRINQTGPEATSKDIVVTLGLSQAGLDLYNKDTQHVVGTMVPANAISFPATVTIEAGTDEFGNHNRTATAELVIHASQIPTTAGVNYVVSFGILSVSPNITISGNFGAILFNFYHNPYDGVYSMGGQMDRYSASTGASLNDGLDGPMQAGLETDVITLGETTSLFTMKWANGGGVGGVGLTATPRITVNADNTITLEIVDGGATPANWGPIPGKLNYYDPVAKAFHINWKWAADAPSPTTTTRGMEYVLTWVRSR